MIDKLIAYTLQKTNIMARNAFIKMALEISWRDWFRTTISKLRKVERT